MTQSRVLRDVEVADLDAFYEYELDPEATAMARFPARTRDAFDAHWKGLLADDSKIKKTIVHDGVVAGNIGCWEQEGRHFVGYWIGRAFWGKGLATRALRELAEDLPIRPLFAWVVASNVASIRVLEKCGFVRVASHTDFDEQRQEPIEELLFELVERPKPATVDLAQSSRSGR